MSNPQFAALPKFPNDEHIVEDLTGIHSEDPLFSHELSQILDIEPTTEKKKTTEPSPSDFDKIKQLVLTNQSLKEFLTDIEDKFSTNINGHESEMKLLVTELKEFNEKTKF